MVAALRDLQPGALYAGCKQARLRKRLDRVLAIFKEPPKRLAFPPFGSPPVTRCSPSARSRGSRPIARARNLANGCHRGAVGPRMIEAGIC